MGLKSTKILGISITTNSKDEILEETRKYLESGVKKPFIIVTPNPEQLVLAQRNSRFAEILNRADVAVPDGIGLVWASRVLSAGSLAKRIPGVELMEDLAAIAAKWTYRIGLIGGRGGVAVKALECLQKKYPGLDGWAKEPESVKDGLYPEADIVFVGLGAPKQEYLMEKLQETWNKQQARNKNPNMSHVSCPMLLMSVGGSFDMIAGKTPRAPSQLRTIGFEWLWRLLKEPWRWKRQLALLKFIWLTLLAKD